MLNLGQRFVTDARTEIPALLLAALSALAVGLAAHPLAILLGAGD